MILIYTSIYTSTIHRPLYCTFISLIAEPLSSIINSSFRTGIVPLDLKSAKVIPLLKSGDHNNFINYRPISILPYFSKLFEKLCVVDFTTIFDEFHLLNSSQFGFRIILLICHYYCYNLLFLMLLMLVMLFLLCILIYKF